MKPIQGRGLNPKTVEKYLGKTFGRLTVLELIPVFYKQARAICKCSCGEVVNVRTDGLNRGPNNSCGCFSREWLKEHRVITHGKSKTRAYKAWKSAKGRCYNPKDARYKNYGKRGISMSDEFRNSFEAFYREIGDPPPGLSLHRPKNDRPYEKGNCVWATDEVQANSKTNNRLITYNGVTQTMAQWAREFEIPWGTLRARLQSGWSVHDALTTLVRD